MPDRRNDLHVLGGGDERELLLVGVHNDGLGADGHEPVAPFVVGPVVLVAEDIVHLEADV